MHIKKILVLFAVALVGLGALWAETIEVKVTKPVGISSVSDTPAPVPVVAVIMPDSQDLFWVTSQTRYSIAAPVGIQYRGESGKLSTDIAVSDRIAPKIGFLFEFMQEEIGGIYPGARFEFGSAFYPLYPMTWNDCGGRIMTDMSFVFRILLHTRPKIMDGRFDFYMGCGFETSLFNPRSDQNEVQAAFGHEMGKFGNFDQGAGLNALGGLAFDFAKNDRIKLTAFIEGEIRHLLPMHIYLGAQAGIKCVFS